MNFLFWILLVLTIFPCGETMASQSMPITVANHKTKQCATLFTGDECVTCTPPPGWESTQKTGGSCPEGYTKSKRKVQGICIGRKTQFCCTVMHSGAQGDCDDVVVHEQNGQCAFVEDILQCKQLPPGWKKPKNQEFWGRICPSLEHKWLQKPLQCPTR